MHTCTATAGSLWPVEGDRPDWSERYRTGEPDLDQQHISIFHLIQAFMRADAVHELHACLDQLLHFLSAHFDYEEALMKTLTFTDYAEHVRSHHQLLDRLHKLRQRLSGDGLDKMEMDVFLKHWAQSHMAVADARFSEFLNFDGKRSAFL